MNRYRIYFDSAIRRARARDILAIFWPLQLAIKCWFQRRIWGFDDKDVFNLDTHFSKLIVPRLKRFKHKIAKRGGYPMELESMEEWLGIIDEMIAGFEIGGSSEKYDLSWGPELATDPRYIKMNRATELFHKYFFNLWW